MMAFQARELFPFRSYGAHSLRAYPVGSPRAKARLVALALVADGRIAHEEIEALARHDAYRTLGISRENFFDVLFDFYGDAARLSDREKGNWLSSPTLAAVFAEVSSPAERQSVARLMFDVIRSDGRVATGERQLFWNALDAWNMRLEDVPGLGMRLAAKTYRHDRRP